jgi:hypothetical protein
LQVLYFLECLSPPIFFVFLSVYISNSTSLEWYSLTALFLTLASRIYFIPNSMSYCTVVWFSCWAFNSIMVTEYSFFVRYCTVALSFWSFPQIRHWDKDLDTDNLSESLSQEVQVKMWRKWIKKGVLISRLLLQIPGVHSTGYLLRTCLSQMSQNFPSGCQGGSGKYLEEL